MRPFLSEQCGIAFNWHLKRPIWRLSPVWPEQSIISISISNPTPSIFLNDSAFYKRLSVGEATNELSKQMRIHRQVETCHLRAFGLFFELFFTLYLSKYFIFTFIITVISIPFKTYKWHPRIGEHAHPDCLMLGGSPAVQYNNNRWSDYIMNETSREE